MMWMYIIPHWIIFSERIEHEDRYSGLLNVGKSTLFNSITKQEGMC